MYPVAQGSLKLEILVLQSSKCWDYKSEPLHQAFFFFIQQHG
jgi:hypothetical protein